MRGLFFGAILSLSIVGCDGQDADRLNRVGKKFVEKIRLFAERANLPKIEVHWQRSDSNSEKPVNEK
ncbi:MAG: hypothetical protein N2039_00250 [Gemmataceae bacterium]|nr:hypothetical protein [Gemmataceae bacterium]